MNSRRSTWCFRMFHPVKRLHGWRAHAITVATIGKPGAGGTHDQVRTRVDDQGPLTRVHRMRRARRAANGRDRAVGQRHHPGDGDRRERRGHGGRQDHRHQRRHGPDPYRHLRRERRIRRPVDSDRAIHGDGRSGRVQDAGALEHRARRRPAGANRSQARSRRADRVGHHRSRRVRSSRPRRPSWGRR